MAIDNDSEFQGRLEQAFQGRAASGRGAFCRKRAGAEQGRQSEECDQCSQAQRHYRRRT